MLAVLARLDESFVQELEKGLNESAPSLAKHELLGHLRELPTLDSAPFLDSLVETLISLASSEYTSQAPQGPLIAGVITNLKEEPDGSGLTESEEATLSDRLTRLLSTRCIHLVSRGTVLKSSHSHIYRSARVISDLRPLFTEVDGNQTISAALLNHDLCLRTTHNQVTENIFVSMDSDDLLQLSKAIERAIKKDRALRIFATISKIPIITPEME
jgi:hypothetical protein